MNNIPQILSIVLCPKCKMDSIIENNKQLICQKCHSTYKIESSKINFLTDQSHTFIDYKLSLKEKLKSYPRFYQFLIDLISPVMPSQILEKFLDENKLDNKIIINLGSGNSKVCSKAINLDLFPYENVHIICDLSDLPVKSESVDTIVNIAVLEHVCSPEIVVNEMHRILKNDGEALLFIPFIQGYHAAPHDYQRYTSQGIMILLKKFKFIKIIPWGPTSGLLWIFQSWIALLLSFNSKRLYSFIYNFILLLTFPLKFFDYFLNSHPCAEYIASGFYVKCKK